MKIKTKDYALALAALIYEAKSDAKDITERFLELLVKNGDIKKAKEILVAAEKLLLAKTGNKKIVLEMARSSGAASTAFLKKGDVLEKKINPELIAGVKIVIDDEKQLDFSLAKKLNQIF